MGTVHLPLEAVANAKAQSGGENHDWKGLESASENCMMGNNNQPRTDVALNARSPSSLQR
jgi:hypothetical protein